MPRQARIDIPGARNSATIQNYSAQSTSHQSRDVRPALPQNLWVPFGSGSAIPVVRTDPAYDSLNASRDPAYFVVNTPQKASIEPYVYNDYTNALRDTFIYRSLKNFPRIQNGLTWFGPIIGIFDPLPPESH